MLDEVDWLIARKKNQTTSDKSGSGKKRFHTVGFMVRADRGRDASLSVDGTYTSVMLRVGEATQTAGQQDPIEKAVTLQLGTLLTALNELVQTALLPGTCTITLLRELTRTYNILTTLVKYVRTGPIICVNVELMTFVWRDSLFCFQYIQVCASQQSALPARFEKLVSLMYCLSAHIFYFS